MAASEGASERESMTARGKPAGRTDAQSASSFAAAFGRVLALDHLLASRSPAWQSARTRAIFGQPLYLFVKPRSALAIAALVDRKTKTARNASRDNKTAQRAYQRRI